MRARRLLVTSCLVSVLVAGLGAQKTPPRGGLNSITPADLNEWLSYIASDQLEGRLVYTEGLGLAAAYIANHLSDWGVKPGGDNGTYFQPVKVLGVRSTSKASVTVDVNGEKRTFKDGEEITFPRNMGGKQTIDGDQIQFVGYGLQIPSAGIDDYAGVDPKGKIVIYLGQQGPKTVPAGSGRLLGARARNAVEKGAAAVIGVPGFGFGGGGRGAAQNAPAAGAAGTPVPQPAGAPAPQTPAQPAGRGRANQPDNGDFTTAQRYDRPIVPALIARDEFFEFLFSGSGTTYAELKDKAAKMEPLPVMALKGVKITIDVDADYAVVRTRLSRNVVGTVSGTDRGLNDTYVAFGAHYDHVGYRDGPPPAGTAAAEPYDRISNGADDDGSGTVALMALARAFAQGPKPKRSLLFVWHTGEESGLWGSRYNADFPIVPNEQIVAQLNIDMIGRNRNDKPEEANTVYLVGSDRISTELHNLSEDANAKMTTPMKLDYEMNDPADPESIYTRSDHYSYAAKGIPIIFYTTGLHKDYHRVTDSVEKIEFPKLAHITQLVYATAVKVANLDHAPVRDNKGPRMGKGSAGRIEGK
jgi:peptidase M28-like protein